MFRKAHRGTFLGFVLMSGMFISVVTFFFTVDNGRAMEGHTIYLVTDIVIHVIVLSAVLLAGYQMSVLSFTAKGLGIDDILLFISMSGSFFFEMSLMVSTSTCLSYGDLCEDSDTEDYIIILDWCIKGKHPTILH